jgi:CHAD domain-containing protein
MGTDHREVERKFEADEPLADAATSTDRLVPDALGLAAGPRQTHHLDATYYDTEHLRLAGAGISFRRRTGGGDAGWHLKLPRTGDARDEIHRPLGRSARPPASLTRTLTGATGGAALVPVAVVRTKRTSWPLLADDGAVLAVVSEDDVTAHAADSADKPLHWTEIEVELVDGDDRILDRVEGVFSTAGIRRSSAASKVARVLGVGPAAVDPDPRTAAAATHRYLLGHLNAYIRAELSVRTDDLSVHDLRVESRRLRTVLAVYRDLLDPARTRHLQQELRWVGRVLGDLRDIEVTHRRLDRALDADVATTGAKGASAPARRLLRAEELDARRAVRQMLGSQRYARLLDGLQSFVSDPPWTPLSGGDAAKVLPELAAKPARRLRKAAKRQRAPDSGDTERHDLRKAARRLRYAMELVQPVDGRANKARKASRALQSRLGDYLDERRLQAVLWRLRVADVPTRVAFTYGRLHARSEAASNRHLARAGRHQRRALVRARTFG